MKKYLILIIFLTGSIVYAANVSDLYSVSIPVQSSSEELRQQDIQRSFKEVLIKVSGKTSFALGKQFKSLSSKAKDYVQDYDYSNDPRNMLLLNIRFLHSAINGLLKQLNQPIWGQDRPLTVVWILLNNLQGDKLVQDNAINLINQEIQKNADRRGIPVLFPILDVTDVQNVTASDLEIPAMDVIQKASVRYHPDSILVINMNEKDPNHLSAKWTLMVNNQMAQWETLGADEKAVIASGIDVVADKLAAQFSVSPRAKTQTGLMIAVQKLNDVEDYAKISQYLSGLDGVENVQIVNIAPDQAMFRLVLSTSVPALKKQIGLSALLAPASDTELPTVSNSGLGGAMVVYEAR